MGGEPLGHQARAGIEADGYSFDERAVGDAGLARTTGEVWVATAGGFVVAYSMTSEGGTDLFGDGIEGTITWQYELTDMNAPAPIEVPEDCPEGLIEAPMLPDAANIVDAPGLLTYDTASTVADVLAFYEEHGPEVGWVPAGEPAVGDTSASVDYSNGDDFVTLIVRTTDSGARVNLWPVTNPSAGVTWGAAAELQRVA